MHSQLHPSALYCAYLRKSRRDMELEALGQGETLARHEQQLSDLAARLGISIAQTYREIVSGDTIADRPQMSKLLRDISAGTWDGVLVMDVDRLARGDSIDQGMVFQALLYSGTLVITPDKIYDPTDEADAEFFEIKLFFGRREYKMINKRMQRGRLQSALDGCYQSPNLYGYKKVKLQSRKGYSLEIVPEQARIVRSIYQWYAYGMDGRDVGANSIANRLNALGLVTLHGNPWTPSAVKTILRNPTYAGKIHWNEREQRVKLVDGRRVKSRVLSDTPILVDGLHEAIIDEELWNRVCEMMQGHAKRPKSAMRSLVNPFAGLIYCAECGRALQCKSDPTRKGDFIGCVRQGCPTFSAYVYVLEDMVLSFLAEWVADYEASAEAPAPDPDAEARASALAHQLEQLDALEKQSNRLFDLLEQGVYTVEIYKQRRAELDARLAATRASVADLRGASRKRPDIGPMIPQIKKVLDVYRSAPSIEDKNALLHTVIERIEYRKPRRLYRNNNLSDYITLTITPKYPTDTDNPDTSVF